MEIRTFLHIVIEAIKQKGGGLTGNSVVNSAAAAALNSPDSLAEDQCLYLLDTPIGWFYNSDVVMDVWLDLLWAELVAKLGIIPPTRTRLFGSDTKIVSIARL
jgi:hypothetical protein